MITCSKSIFVTLLCFSFMRFALAQAPTCVPPADLTLSCEFFDPTLSVYGSVIIDSSVCLDTIAETHDFSLFDTTCSTGQILRTFLVTDCIGLSGECVQTITLTHHIDYYIHFPQDSIAADCSVGNLYGEPLVFDIDCEDVRVISNDNILSIVPNACFQISRRWLIYNSCTYNPDLPCVQIPNPNPSAITSDPSNLNAPVLKLTPYAANDTSVSEDMRSSLISITPGAAPTDYSTFYMSNANCYEYTQIIKIVDNVRPVIDSCQSSGTVLFGDLSDNDSQIWNDPLFIDPVHSTKDLSEGQVNLHITAADQCHGSSLIVRYLLFLDTDNDGTLETVVNSNNPPPAGYVNVGNANNPNYSGGTPVRFDQRSVPSDQVWRFGLKNEMLNGKITSSVGFGRQDMPGVFVEPYLPHGTHKVRWFVVDACGNEAICETLFTIRDTDPPMVECLNGISANIMPTGMIDIFDTEMLLFTTDNSTNSNQLRTAICRSCTSFPYDALGNPVKSVRFQCPDLGTKTVRIWSIDKAGNAAFCDTYVLVQDNEGNCDPQPAEFVSGYVTCTTKDGIVPLVDVKVDLNIQSSGIPTINLTTSTLLSGYYVFSINNIPVGPATIFPSKDGDHLNGVDMLDALKIHRHVLALEPLPNPYRQIAADVNNSRSITSADVFLMRKLILGAISTWPNLNSFRFVPKGFSFLSNDPFATVFPETIQLPTGASTDAANFEGIKVGDVNGSFLPQFAAMDDRMISPFFYEMQNASLKPDELISLQFKSNADIAAVQFTLDLHGLEFTSTTLPPDMYHVHRDAVTVAAEEPGSFAMQFRSKRTGVLSEMIELNSRITEAIAFTETDERNKIQLRFGESMNGLEQGFTVYQNKPNPFTESTTIGFYLPKASKTRLTIHDQLGRLIYTESCQCKKGANAFTLDSEQLTATGVFYYTISTEDWSKTRSMIVGLPNE